jgi:dipeptide/tripeptide permease
MRALLVLYLVNALGWSGGRAANLYGTYTSAVYLTPLLGGWLADKFIGTGRSLVIGGLIITVGPTAPRSSAARWPRSTAASSSSSSARASSSRT